MAKKQTTLQTPANNERASKPAPPADNTQSAGSPLVFEPLYTIESAQALTLLSADTLRTALSTGELCGYKKARRWFILHSDLVQWIKKE